LPPLIGIDFGTTNSVVAVRQADGSVRTARFANDTLDVFRTVLCFWRHAGPGVLHHAAGRGTLSHASGPAAVEAYLDDPLDSRLIMSMKTYLAQRSFRQTQVHGRPFTLEQLIALFLQDLLAGVDLAGARIIAGRPARFAGDLADDALGETRLREAYRQAGLGEIEVAFEPEAAGYRFTRSLTGAATVLIGDFGGGTSDFSILQFDPGAGRTVTPLATVGVGVAGDALDYRIIDRVVSPRLGKGSTYRIMDNDMPIPAEYYAGLARWHRLSLMRTPKTLREIADVARTAAAPEQLLCLLHLIQEELGYPLYQVVSGVKAALSSADEAVLRFQHDDIDIVETVARVDFEAWIAPELALLSAAVDRALTQAEVRAEEIDRVFLTGGTSVVPAVRRLFEQRFGADRVAGNGADDMTDAGGAFVSVAEGLVLIGQERAGQ
jgi:hypothetical chaperone protein